MASLCLTLPLLAGDKAQLDYQLRKLTAKFEAMQANPEKAIPTETLRKTRDMVLLDRTKAGFVFAFQGGGGPEESRLKSAGLSGLQSQAEPAHQLRLDLFCTTPNLGAIRSSSVAVATQSRLWSTSFA